MNISKHEQRALHVLALGGHLRHERAEGTRITSVTCVTREGLVLSGFDLTLFHKLRRKRLIESRSGHPCRISRRGRLPVRAQLDHTGQDNTGHANTGSMTC
ncbi:YjhX family toxin [Celeribacter sp. SCSIO 80788]|uniref:YjhX family toxin n=1 Tax=Celeribacter sp. SCSIO 80788 TaxID=3117013 RepID=UPI003DA36A78